MNTLILSFSLIFNNFTTSNISEDIKEPIFVRYPKIAHVGQPFLNALRQLR